jgi:hypothetical protein
MIDLSAVTEAAAHDPLVLILGVFLLGGVVTHFLFKKYPIGRAIVRVIFLILLTIALLHAEIVPYLPLRSTGAPFHDAVQAILKIAWWLLAAWFLVGTLRAVVVFQRSPREESCFKTCSRVSFILPRSLPLSPMSSISRSRVCWRRRALLP